MPLDPNAQIAITLNAAQWNIVLTQLAEGPYRVVAALMQSIAQQCEAHAEASQQPSLSHLRAVAEVRND